jgi:hypothetical protein
VLNVDDLVVEVLDAERRRLHRLRVSRRADGPGTPPPGAAAGDPGVPAP